MDFQKLFSLDGRVGRQDFIIVTIGIIVFSVALGLIGEVGGETLKNLMTLITVIGAFAVGIPNEFKRLHDTGKSGWWILIGLIPIIGWIWAFWLFYLKPGDKGPNQYGLPNNGSPFA